MSDDQVIAFNHYTKPMVSKDVIMARSAFTTSSQAWEEKCMHITTLNLQMMKCGHEQKFRDMITCRAVAKYENLLRNHRSGVKVMYRKRADMVSQWEREGGKPTKADWFKKSGAT